MSCGKVRYNSPLDNLHIGCTLKMVGVLDINLELLDMGLTKPQPNRKYGFVVIHGEPVWNFEFMLKEKDNLHR